MTPLVDFMDSAQTVSIVMAAYNAAQLLPHSVASIRHQTHTHWELWIVDDGSADNTAAVAAQLAQQDARIHCVTQTNGGTASARNHALRLCTGQWIAFLDADDRWLPTYLTTALHTLSTAPNPVGLAYSWYYGVDETDHLVVKSPAYTITGMAFHDVLSRESLLLPSTTVMHRRVLDACPQFLTEHIHEDREYFLRVCQQFPIYPMGQRLVLYQQSASGKCRALLQHYDKAVHAELSIVESVAHLLQPNEITQLKQAQKKNLFYRFLMYNFMQEARRLWGDQPIWTLFSDKKGILAALSLISGFSWLFVVRVLIQKGILWIMHPIWRQKLRGLMTPP
jgi:glycosyltransferase involved in cell wall biosynthesis